MGQPTHLFARDYEEARRLFLSAAEEAGAHLVTCRLSPAEGAVPELAMDVAWFGRRDATRLFVASAGTIGASGLAGSAAQLAWIMQGAHKALSSPVAVLMIHAVNPWGFHHCRRVDQDNIDPDRNFIDFALGLPRNPGFEILAPALMPADWSHRSIATMVEAQRLYASHYGQTGLWRAVAGGQFSHPDGPYFGGRRSSWSQRQLERIIKAIPDTVEKIAWLDVRTDAGIFGAPTIAATGPEITDHADALFGDATIADDAPDMVSGATGSLIGGIARILTDRCLGAASLSIGTFEESRVLEAVIGDSWLARHGDADADQAETRRDEFREAFHPQNENWRLQVLERALEAFEWVPAAMEAM